MSNTSAALFSTEYKYFLNYGNGTGSLTIPATSVTGAASGGNIVVPLTSDDNFSQVQLNFSTDSNNYFKFPMLDFALDANFNIAVTGSRTSDALTLNFYLVRTGPGAATSTAVTITANYYLFETPS